MSVVTAAACLVSGAPARPPVPRWVHGRVGATPAHAEDTYIEAMGANR